MQNFNNYLVSFNSKSPLDQFEIRDLISIDAPIIDNLHLSITNIALYLIMASLLMFSLHLIIEDTNKLTLNN